MGANENGRTTSPSKVGGIPTPALFEFLRPISLKEKRNPDKVDTVERYHHRAVMPKERMTVTSAVKYKPPTERAKWVQFPPRSTKQFFKTLNNAVVGQCSESSGL